MRLIDFQVLPETDEVKTLASEYRGKMNENQYRNG